MALNTPDEPVIEQKEYAIENDSTQNLPERGSSTFLETLKRELASGSGKIVSRLPEHELQEMLRRVKRLYLDLDGTMLQSGTASFEKRTIDVLRLLLDNKLDVTIITGKPYTEIERLLENTPDDVRDRLQILYEKGAYRYGGPENPSIPFLTDEEGDIEHTIADLREECFSAWAPEILKRYGVKLIPAGDGSHRSVLSFDLIRPDAEFMSEEADRRSAKITNTVLIRNVYQELEGLLQSRMAHNQNIPLELTDLGNANFEINSPFIDKSVILQKLEGRRSPKEGSALAIGDSGNDERMFEEAHQIPHVEVGLVYHDRTPEHLADFADIAVSGHARGDRLLAKIGHAQGLVENLVIMSNTPSVQRVKKKNGGNGNGENGSETSEFKNRMGAPVAIGRVVEKTRKALWLFPSRDNDAFRDHPNENLRGKFRPVSITPEEHISHYDRTSNEGWWYFDHPETFPTVAEFSPEDYGRYITVNDKLAHELHTALLTDDLTYVCTEDFQVTPLAKRFRHLYPNRSSVRFGYFTHTPFVGPKDADRLPAQYIRERLEWIGAYDVAGFHTEQNVKNYLALCEKFGVAPTRTFVQPISIDVPEIQRRAIEIARARDFRFKDPRLNAFFQLDLPPELREEVIMGPPERADPIKGGRQRLRIDGKIAKHNPRLFEGKRFLEVMVPTRDGNQFYKTNYRRMEQQVDVINRRLGRTAVHTIDRIDDRDDIVGAMYLSKKARFTSINDGYNMTIPEYLAVAAATRHFRRAHRQIYATAGTGFVQSLVEHNMGEAIPVLSSPLNKTEFRMKEEQLLIGNLPEPRYPLIDRYLARNDLHGWMRRKLHELMDANFGRDVTVVR